MSSNICLRTESHNVVFGQVLQVTCLHAHEIFYLEKISMRATILRFRGIYLVLDYREAEDKYK